MEIIFEAPRDDSFDERVYEANMHVVEEILLDFRQDIWNGNRGMHWLNPTKKAMIAIANYMEESENFTMLTEKAKEKFEWLFEYFIERETDYLISYFCEEISLIDDVLWENGMEIFTKECKEKMFFIDQKDIENIFKSTFNID